jgi:polyhydroxyalkanoate synthesis regulator phasin
MVKRYIHKPVEGREPTSEILKRLKEQESRTKAKLESFSMGRKQDVIVDRAPQTTVFREKPKNIPEHNIDMLMRDIEALERKMKDTSNYLALFYEMKELEEKFMKNVEFIEKQNIDIGPDIRKRVEYRKGIIERKKRV